MTSQLQPDSLDVLVGARRKPDSAHVLRSILARLKHLDLTGKTRFESAVMKTHGGYADVFIGYATLELGLNRGPEEIKVAIKRLRIHIQGDSDFAKTLSKEIRVWSRLNHPNVLAFLGYALEGEDYPLLVSEWMENGTAMTYVNENAECDLTCMFLGIAQGLSYLHSQGVVHADMKADNVLVAADGQPRICDFGISSILAASSTFGAMSSHNYGTRGSLRWMAAEFFEMTGPPALHSEKTDVWAFGMTVYELLTKQIPYAQIKLDPQVLLTIMHGILPICPDSFSDLPGCAPQVRIWCICCDCWRRDPASRPSMASIVHMLSRVKEAASVHGAEDDHSRCPRDSSDTTWLQTQVDLNIAQQFLHDEDHTTEGRVLSFANPSSSTSQTSLGIDTHTPSTRSLEKSTSSNYPTSLDPVAVQREWGSGKPWGVRFEVPSPLSLTSGAFAGSSLTLSSELNTSATSFPSAENLILKEGYLAEVTDDPVFRLYTTRYYILGPSSLTYYRRIGGELLGTINVLGAQLPDESGRKRGYENALLLITQRNMGLSDAASLRILYAESHSECKEWVSALQQLASGNEEVSRRSYSIPAGSMVQETLGHVPDDHASASTVLVGTGAKVVGKTATQRSRLFSIFRRFTS